MLTNEYDLSKMRCERPLQKELKSGACTIHVLKIGDQHKRWREGGADNIWPTRNLYNCRCGRNFVQTADKRSSTKSNYPFPALP